MTLMPTEAREAELGALCRACGACCDGSIFQRVSLEPGEVSLARRHGLRVVERGGAFEQPCPAFRGSVEGCGIYAERPRACHRFRCRLYERHRREGGPLEERLAVVARMRELGERLESSGFDPAELPEALKDDLDELTEILVRDFARADAI